MLFYRVTVVLCDRSSSFYNLYINLIHTLCIIRCLASNSLTKNSYCARSRFTCVLKCGQCPFVLVTCQAGCFMHLYYPVWMRTCICNINEDTRKRAAEILSHFRKTPCFCHMRTAKMQISLRIRAVWSTFQRLCYLLSTDAEPKILKLLLASVAEQAGLSLTSSQPPKTDFLVTR